MNAIVRKIAWSQGRDVVRSRWIAVYTGFFLVLTEGLLRFAGTESMAVLSLSTATLMIIPLATLMLSTMYVYGTRDFTELLLAQPIRRVDLYAGLYLGLALPTVGGFLLGVGIPFALRGGLGGPVATLLAVGTALTFAFSAIAFCIALRADERLRGMSIALGVWLLAAVIYDGVVLTLVALFGDYPIERPLLGVMFANPVDLGRVMLLLRLDASALMGYTGAVFERFFAGTGFVVASALLALWIVLPSTLGARLFRAKDF
jgi:Cu-processing system permease protein